MSRKFLYITADVADMYSEKRIARAAAALSYYLTMTLFPMLICLYYLLGKNSMRVAEALDLASRFISSETAAFLDDFLAHVVRSSSPALLFAGLTVLLTSSSAAIRTIQATIGEMQGGMRFRGITYFIVSLVFSLLFLAGMYISVLVIITGRAVLGFLNDILSFVDISSSWVYLRFLILAGIMFLLFWAVYQMAKRRTDNYRSYPGALLATLATVIMSAAFSVFIDFSAKYSLVYGSIASVILLMLWLYICCQIIYIGAAFNIALRNARIAQEQKQYSSGRLRLQELQGKFQEGRAGIAQGKLMLSELRRRTAPVKNSGSGNERKKSPRGKNLRKVEISDTDSQKRRNTH